MVDVRLAFGLWKERNPISTRVELGCLGLAGTLWLGVCLPSSHRISFPVHSSWRLSIALGAFVASSDSEMADVECFSSSDADAEPIDIPGCKCNRPTSDTLASDPLHSQHGDLPRSVPRLGGVLLLQHDSQ